MALRRTAMITLVLSGTTGAGIYYYNQHQHKHQQPEVVAGNDWRLDDKATLYVSESFLASSSYPPRNTHHSFIHSSLHHVF